MTHDPPETTQYPWPTVEEDHGEEMLAWLLPLATAIGSALILWACNHFGWLQ